MRYFLFVVLYESNVPNKYCIAGPDKKKHKFWCKHVNHPWSSKHVKHVKLVYEAIGNPESKLANLFLIEVLSNCNRVFELGATSAESGNIDDYFIFIDVYLVFLYII